MEKQNDAKYSQSTLQHMQAKRYLSGGVSSNFRMGMKPLPLFFKRAQGARLYDVDGNEYVDYALGMGPVILGHAHPAVNDVVKSSLSKGQLFAGQHQMELELAREVCAIIPCAEMVRFSMSGTEAVQGALRLARAYTGRSGLIKFEGHYHGWLDNIYVSVNPKEQMGPEQSPNRVPESEGQDPNAFHELRILPWNNIEALREQLKSDGDVAAVIMEPIMCNTAVIPPKPGYLEEVRKICTEHDVVLIFDEVITGFRVALGGAQELLGVTPDLAIFAKAMANGYPISCIAGRADIMELFGSQSVVHGGTFNSNVVSCAAALATVHYLRDNESTVYPGIRKVGKLVQDGLRAISQDGNHELLVQGLPMVFHTNFTRQTKIENYREHYRSDLNRRTSFVNTLQDLGVRTTSRATWFLSVAHNEDDVEITLQAAQKALSSMVHATTL